MSCKKSEIRPVSSTDKTTIDRIDRRCFIIQICPVGRTVIIDIGRITQVSRVRSLLQDICIAVIKWFSEILFKFSVYRRYIRRSRKSEMPVNTDTSLPCRCIFGSYINNSVRCSWSVDSRSTVILQYINRFDIVRIQYSVNIGCSSDRLYSIILDIIYNCRILRQRNAIHNNQRLILIEICRM